MHDAIGRTTTTTDIMDPARAEALHAVLGLDTPPPQPGDPLPPFWHQIYFWTIANAADLGPDGHPALGGFIPDLGLPNRMWAGGNLSFLNPLITGVPATRISTIESIDLKQGRSGPLGFVTVRHEVTQAGKLTVTDKQNIVYRPASARSSARSSTAPTDENAVIAVRYPETMLFRYSALTFNAHRIHYDQEFSRSSMGMSAPLVHGPLLAQGLMLLAQQKLGAIRHFEFRAISPLAVGVAAELCWRSDGAAWVRGMDGRLIMSATAS
jgi:3-methylfumaryl-CoA hydratase